MKPVKLSASILASNFMQLGNEVDAVVNGGADWVHVDVMDGSFVPNITIGVPVVEGLKKIFRAKKNNNFFKRWFSFLPESLLKRIINM